MTQATAAVAVGDAALLARIGRQALIGALEAAVDAVVGRVVTRLGGMAESGRPWRRRLRQLRVSRWRALAQGGFFLIQVLACLSEIAGTFIWPEEVDGPRDGFPEVRDGAGAGQSQERPEFGEGG